MKVEVIKEAGYEEAMLGIGLSYGITSECSTVDEIPAHVLNKLHRIAVKLSKKGGGEDKFLRQMCVWVDVEAPLYWYPQFDQYRIGCTTQSESRMHTLANEPITIDRFETENLSDLGVLTLEATVKNCEELRLAYNSLKAKENLGGATLAWRALIALLPESWLQRRIWSANYAVLRNIISQRRGHKLPEWETFIDAIQNGVNFPEFLEM